MNDRPSVISEVTRHGRQFPAGSKSIDEALAATDGAPTEDNDSGVARCRFQGGKLATRQQHLFAGGRLLGDDGFFAACSATETAAAIARDAGSERAKQQLRNGGERGTVRHSSAARQKGQPSFAVAPSSVPFCKQHDARHGSNGAINIAKAIATTANCRAMPDFMQHQTGSRNPTARNAVIFGIFGAKVNLFRLFVADVRK